MRTITFTEASRAGLSALVALAETGIDIALSLHGKVVAAEEISILRHNRDTLRDAALAMSRLASDTGNRTDLDQALEAENASDIAAGRA